MKRVFIAGVMFEVLALIIGLTWITPLAHRSSAAELPPVSSTAPASSPTAPASPAVSPPVSAGGGTVSVALNQWSVTPTATTIPAGKVSIKVSNAGSITHELVVLQTDTLAADIPITSYEGVKDRINEKTTGTNVGETGDMTVGKTKTITLNLQPGHYVFLCNLPAHFGLGMHTDVTVSAAAVASPAVSPPVSAGGGTVSVALNQWSVTPTATTIPAGKVSIKVSNAGSITHELVVLQTDTLAADIPITSYEGVKDRINEKTTGTNVGETGDMTVGKTKTITLNLQPGHYVFLCNLPAHFGLGMHTDVTVSAA